MATWQKVIVSGSNAHLSQITSSVLTDTYLVIAGGGGALKDSNTSIQTGSFNIRTNSILSVGTASMLTGSFTGSFKGQAFLASLSQSHGIVPFVYSGSEVASIAVSGAALLVNQNVTKWNGHAFVSSSITDSGSLVTIDNDVIINRDLTVFGTASFQNATNLDVADRFIRLASGSNTVTDGGIAIQQNNSTNAEVFAFDSTTTRWGVTSSFNPANNAYTPDAYVSLVLEGAGNDPTVVGARYQVKGNMFIGADENIWIYS